MCNIIFLPSSSVVRIIDYIWRKHFFHIFSLVSSVLPTFENTDTVIPK